jgi:DNA polymerase III subunit epsilon
VQRECEEEGGPRVEGEELEHERAERRDPRRGEVANGRDACQHLCDRGEGNQEPEREPRSGGEAQRRGEQRGERSEGGSEGEFDARDGEGPARVGRCEGHVEREERDGDGERGRAGDRHGRRASRRAGIESRDRQATVGVRHEREGEPHEARQHEERERRARPPKRLGGDEHTQHRERLTRTKGRQGDGQEAGQEGSEHGESLARHVARGESCYARGMFYQGLGVSSSTNEVTVRRLAFPPPAPSFADAEWLRENEEHLSLGLAIDCETTGLDPFRDTIIEIAMVPFLYDRRTARVVAYEEPFHGLEDPGEPLTPEIVKLTGLTDEDLRGKHIDRSAALALLQRAAIVIAHNAGFDRPFVEAFLDVDVRERRPIWGCSLQQVDWEAKGMPAAKLEVLSVFHGFFIGNHRAVADATALLHLLTFDDATTGVPYLHELLARMREPSVLVRAVGSAIETKDLLKARRYQWNAPARVWQRTIPRRDLEAEEAWLAETIYRGKSRATVTELPVHARFRRGEGEGEGT